MIDYACQTERSLARRREVLRHWLWLPVGAVALAAVAWLILVMLFCFA
jgi:hypothetical protein